jgi:hypothetical protein
MDVPGDEDEQRQGFRLAFEAAPLTLEQVWIKYFGIGGKAGLTEVEAYVHVGLSLPPLERDLLAHALNESLNGLGVNGRRASYSQAIYPKADEGQTGTN